MPHEYEPYDEKDDSCRTCGARYHCGACNGGTGMMGHLVKDDQGFFQKCQEPDRWTAKLERDRLERELKERAELARLKRKYGS